MDLHNFVHSMYTIIQIILHIYIIFQFCTLNIQKFSKKCTQFCTFNIHKFSNNVKNFEFNVYNFSKNIQNSKCSKYTIFQFCTFNVDNISKNIHNSTYLIYTFFFLMNIPNFVYSMYNFKKKKTFVHLRYTVMYILCAQFFKQYTQFVY